MLEIVLRSYILQYITHNNMEGSHSLRVWDGEISYFALMTFALLSLCVCAPPGSQSPGTKAGTEVRIKCLCSLYKICE